MFSDSSLQIESHTNNLPRVALHSCASTCMITSVVPYRYKVGATGASETLLLNNGDAQRGARLTPDTMDPFSISVGILGIISSVTSCLKLAKQHIGPSAMSSTEAESLKKSLYEFLGVMHSFKAHLELHDDDDERLASLEYLTPAVNRSLEALKIVKEYINSGRTDKLFRGVKFDKRLKASLKSLDDARQLFSLAVLADQQTIMLHVNSFVHSISEDVKEVQAVQLSAQQGTVARFVHVRGNVLMSQTPCTRRLLRGLIPRLIAI